MGLKGLQGESRLFGVRERAKRTHIRISSNSEFSFKFYFATNFIL